MVTSKAHSIWLSILRRNVTQLKLRARYGIGRIVANTPAVSHTILGKKSPVVWNKYSTAASAEGSENLNLVSKRISSTSLY